jgi:hypothetical protein
MQRTLQEHMRLLEERILALTTKIERPISTEQERNHLQSEILLAEQALAFLQEGLRA